MSANAVIAWLLSRALPRAASGDGAAWLSEVVAALQAGGDAREALPAFVAATRRMGRAPLPPGEPLPSADGPVSTAAWTTDEAARVALLLAVAAGSPERVEATVNTLFGEGDTREKAAIVRALPLLPGGARWLELALDAGRTNELPMFAALACENPYPAAHYPELEFNKLVMKAVFIGLDLHRVAGLSGRANPELARMAVAYIEQQLSAGRAFPPDLWLAIAKHPPSGAIRSLSADEVARAVSAARAALATENPSGAR